jgi:predicted transcriptional regulator
MKSKTQLLAGVVSLLALLAYTWVHTGGLLSIYVRPAIVGYVAAFGIEAAVVSLSLRIGDLRRSNVSAGFFLFVLVGVVAVSALANIAEGFRTAQSEPLTLSTVQRLDIVQAVIGLAATGLISLIVLALSEIIGTDVNVVVSQAERERQRASRAERQPVSDTESVGTFPAPVEQARLALAEQRERSKAEVLDTLVNVLNAEPDIRVTTLARRVNRSRTTVYSYLDELEQAGRIHRNGKVTAGV